MSDLPSPALIELLEHLHVADVAVLRRVVKVVRRLAGDLPRFDSIWVDALAQAEHITPFQASEINAGRGKQLLVGPFLLCDRLPSLGYADCYRAKALTSGEPFKLLVTSLVDRDPELLLKQLNELIAASRLVSGEVFVPVVDSGSDDACLWLATEWLDGVLVADWLAENGRFSPQVSLHLARQMAEGFADLERAGLLHGDLHVRQMMLLEDGSLRIAHPGVRTLLRSAEGFSLAELPAEAYESVAPERVTAAKPHDARAELFACGCVWWQLLTGRPAIAGGNRLAKLRAVADARISDVRQFAPDAPPVLADLIAACVCLEPSKRPSSLGELTRILGPSTKAGKQAIADCLQRPDRWLFPTLSLPTQPTRRKQQVIEAVAIVACVLVALVGWNRLQAEPKPKSKDIAAVAAKTTLPPAHEAPIATFKQEKPAARTKVTPASYVEPASAARGQAKGVAALQLPVGRLLRLARLTPQAGQMIEGKQGGRPLVSIPAEGLFIEHTDVQFRNIDFIVEANRTSNVSAMITLRAASAVFESCSFQAPSESTALPVAIRWVGSAPSVAESWDAADDELEFKDCVFSGVDAAVECGRASDPRVSFGNTLLVASTALVRSVAEQPTSVSLTLDHCTLRESGAALECATPIARATCMAADCVFATNHQPLLLLSQYSTATTASASIARWSGQGSLVEMDTPLVGHRLEDGEIETVDESVITVSGLARSQLEFAESDLRNPASSKLHRWLAPRQSLDPPGILPDELHLPAQP